ncbi:MAG: hypothetical protein HP049_05605 [Clostridiales bacterium]|nr:hypothetical protein [Clostridiales bacterium]
MGIFSFIGMTVHSFRYAEAPFLTAFFGKSPPRRTFFGRATARTAHGGGFCSTVSYAANAAKKPILPILHNLLSGRSPGSVRKSGRRMQMLKHLNAI